MTTIYDVVADSEYQGVVKASSFGARATRPEAEALLAKEVARYEGSSWRDFRIEEVDTTGLFEIPARPTPRERYTLRVQVTRSMSVPGREIPRGVHVDVLDGERVTGSYDRNYAMLRSFEPFRQGNRDFALISPHYTATSVMDLQTGEIVAGEEPDSWGFCPVGFYVPDWWDINLRAAEHGTLPGSRGWTVDHEWPTGNFGFVWGCIWGDDSSWKVQYLDLSQIQSGTLRREERFGYVVLDTGEPEGRETWRDPREFIELWSDDGEVRVQFLTRRTFDLSTGDERDPFG